MQKAAVASRKMPGSSPCTCQAPSLPLQPKRVTVHRDHVYRPNQRNQSELLTTVADQRAIAAAKMGACSFGKGIRGERIAAGALGVLHPEFR